MPQSASHRASLRLVLGLGLSLLLALTFLTWSADSADAQLILKGNCPSTTCGSLTGWYNSGTCDHNIDGCTYRCKVWTHNTTGAKCKGECNAL